ncbi:SIR2 family protein [Mesorhizobium sp. BR115XR7A]|uniref:P-loop NTPase n=1 Tax=Mesorhizobium sp. BR115XR7A TaxID=2876645 RepID=UPI001CCDF04C|nr:SIR2 family protein [Mesorhizobium sp. BR115XR7A]MBZ9909711.1 SIR2 family protein [Mesorhizobium sp. BR115XR7A]MBZ9933594.1 SIR2 family protein [Mesorhizobium sp. BR1-1-5]
MSLFPESIFADIREGRAVLVTGAGVSGQATNRFGRPIVGTPQIAKLVAEAGDLSYNGEDVKEVFDAIGNSLGSAKYKKIFEDNFTNTRPSEALVQTFTVPWRRVYTFNFDDTIENIPRRQRSQKLYFYNALKDRRVEWKGYSDCQVVHLHGSALNSDVGFIFSSTEYAEASAKNPAWYSQLGEDFIDYTVIFVGTTLREQILFQSVRAALTKDAVPGRSFCITPDSLTEIQSKSLQNRGIVHIKARLEDFAPELNRRFPGGLLPRDVESSGTAATASQQSRFSENDVEALRTVFPISKKNIEKRFSTIVQDISKYRRRFYEGYGPTWPIVSTSSYAILGEFKRVSQEIDILRNEKRAIVVLGEAGSGKSTFVMHYAINLAASGQDISVFEYTEGGPPFKEVMYSLKKFRGDKPCVIIIDDLHVVAEDISEVLNGRSMEGATIVTSARTGEWHDRLGKLFGSNVDTVRFDRFKSEDVEIIIKAIEANFAAPAFNKLSLVEKRQRFTKSRQQLLIAMLEATESKGFEEIIEDEFSRITDTERRWLFLMVAIATVPRVGISKSMASTVLGHLNVTQTFDQLSNGLQGIVDVAKSGRYQARHQIYASEIVQKYASIADIETVLAAMVRYYVQFTSPIIRNLTSHDAQLFKYLLNSNNIYQIFATAGDKSGAVKFYAQFEVLLQLDGHFWLQYALLLRRLGRQQEALEMLGRSIEAFPGNRYAQHALAQQKLIVAAHHDMFTTSTQKLIDEAVTTLMERHHSMGAERLKGALDEYPIVTLGYYHIDALMSHSQVDKAVAAAKLYFSEVDGLLKKYSDPILMELRTRLLTLASTSEWRRLSYKGGQINYN